MVGGHFKGASSIYSLTLQEHENQRPRRSYERSENFCRLDYAVLSSYPLLSVVQPWLPISPTFHVTRLSVSVSVHPSFLFQASILSVATSPVYNPTSTEK